MSKKQDREVMDTQTEKILTFILQPLVRDNSTLKGSELRLKHLKEVLSYIIKWYEGELINRGQVKGRKDSQEINRPREGVENEND